MEKEFIPYAEALTLKELGFDEPCLVWYNLEQNRIMNSGEYYNDGQYYNNVELPLYQQTFRWFREKYKYDITIPPSGDSNGNTIGYYYEIIFQSWDEGIESDSYDTYEEAELECLKKLISIVKEK